MTAAFALELDDVSAGYGETVVLEKVKLALEDGETLSIIGRNGVGKTTLVATIMGHTSLHGGRLRLHGKDLGALSPYRRALAGLGLSFSLLGLSKVRGSTPTSVKLIVAAVRPVCAGVLDETGPNSESCSLLFTLKN